MLIEVRFDVCGSLERKVEEVVIMEVSDDEYLDDTESEDDYDSLYGRETTNQRKSRHASTRVSINKESTSHKCLQCSGPIIKMLESFNIDASHVSNVCDICVEPTTLYFICEKCQLPTCAQCTLCF